MKRFLSLILAAAFTLSLTACKKDDAYYDGVSDAVSDLASDNSENSDPAAFVCQRFAGLNRKTFRRPVRMLAHPLF